MKNKAFIIVTIVMVLIMSQFSILIGAVNANVVEGKKENIDWSFDSQTGTLTFSGAGKIDTDWKNGEISVEDVEEVIIKSGITNIGESAFRDCNNLVSIEIPSGVTDIEGYSFNRM